MTTYAPTSTKGAWGGSVVGDYYYSGERSGAVLIYDLDPTDAPTEAPTVAPSDAPTVGTRTVTDEL